jgi:cation:H+ antiporter
MNAVEVQGLQNEVRELAPETQGPTARQPRAWISLVLLAIGAILLGLGAQSTVTGAVNLARLLGLSESVIGLTIVAGGTGLPEVVTSLVSSFRGRDDVAIGNVIGSNLFNILGILGISALAAPLRVHSDIIARDVWWMLGTTALLFPLMYTGSRVNRWEGGLLLCVYGAYLTFLLLRTN